MDKFYVTTPIYYVNDVPTIGHAYTTIAADVLARYHRRLGKKVFYLTGTDEHGAKVVEAAAAHGKLPQEYCNEIAQRFQEAWRELDISNDYFIRTTDPAHEAVVQAFLACLNERGDIYKARYEGWYCIGCEKFVTEEELVDGLCPDHKRAPVRHEEENYFFRLAKYRDVLANAILDERDPNHFEVAPPARRNEVLGKLRVGLSDISISRATLTWGVPLPFDRSQTAYVWVDALLNYISAIGYNGASDRFACWWPADLHLIGKDILWFHAIVWPAMLLAAGLKPPRAIFAHGYFTIEGQKMSKSLGNVIRPAELVRRFGVDATRYLVLSEFPFGTDGDISISSFAQRYDADLANNLGNLLNRCVSMVNRYCGGVVPGASPRAEGVAERELRARAADTFARLHTAMENWAFTEAVAAIGQLADRANKYVEESAPWALAKSDRERLATVLYYLMETLRLLAEALWPFMPGAASQMAAQLGTKLALEVAWPEPTRWGGYAAGTQVTQHPSPLFPRRE